MGKLKGLQRSRPKNAILVESEGGSSEVQGWEAAGTEVSSPKAIWQPAMPVQEPTSNWTKILFPTQKAG
ncbi:MAG: hypothetical protein KME26_23345 [Oscillatoria princeps RMCB-10]|nr:hypothetical protein [Oscillatoria princeps RMCB-10]